MSEPKPEAGLSEWSALLGRLRRLADVLGELRDTQPHLPTTLPPAFYMGKQSAYAIAASEVRALVDQFADHCASEIEDLYADKSRMDYMEKFVVDWNAKEEHYGVAAGLFYKATMRQCCDAAMKAQLTPNG